MALGQVWTRPRWVRYAHAGSPPWPAAACGHQGLPARLLQLYPAAVPSKEDRVWGELFELGSGAAVVDAGSADIASHAVQVGPDWEDLFNAVRLPRDEQPAPGGNGVPDYVEFHGGQWAVIMTDEVSLGVTIDTTKTG